MKRYTILVHGCDDTTKFSQMLTSFEVEVVKVVAAGITANSTYGCMPKMEVREYDKLIDDPESEDYKQYA